MKVRFFNIQWDTDGANPELPSEAVLEVAADTDVGADGADILSDKFGYCVSAFQFSLA